ncbi:MAG: CoA transferase subunit A [Thermoproteota archaeon]|nr:MAG: CoA transferase subunit A [Candidatus Korarchaeota archaeon]
MNVKKEVGEYIKVLKSGSGKIHWVDPYEFREHVLKKSRDFEDKIMDEQEAISKFVKNGDYIITERSPRDPLALTREVVRQKKRNLWLCSIFQLVVPSFLVAGGCLKGMDVGYPDIARNVWRAIESNKIEVSEWNNDALAMRLLAGSLNIPFIPWYTPTIGTDTLEKSGAKVIDDPYTGRPITLLPALHPDVCIISVHQADKYGNARIFGPSVLHHEAALASQKVIVQAEEIIPHEEFRRRPSLTTIPYFVVDAVVVAPFGCHFKTMPGRYWTDIKAFLEWYSYMAEEDKTEEYLEKYIYSVSSHQEYLEKRVGIRRLLELQFLEREYRGEYYL